LQEDRNGEPSQSALSCRARLRVAVLGVLACLTSVIGSAQLNAAQERYDYDALGRLVRVIDEQGRVTQYVYDAAGNILQVITGGTAQPPAVTSISPTSIVRGETKQVTITGSGLINAEVTVIDPGLDIAGVQSTATQISFTLAAALTASLGLQQINIRNAAGTATASITVNPVPPKLSLAPQPVALPPSTTRNFLVTLSNADTVDHPVSIASANTAIATVSPASVTVSAGQIQATVSVTGLVAGTTSISLSSPGLASTSVPVFVSVEAVGLNTNFAPPLGVVVLSPTGTSPTTVGPLASRQLGIAKGAYIDHVSPTNLAVSTGPTSVVISGNELSGVTGASVLPPDGLTLGPISVAGDGRSVTVPVTVAANAPTTVRRVVLAGAQQPYLAARPGTDQILITLPPPEIFSIDPILAATGTTAATLTIRGRNMQSIRAVTFTPGTGISVDAAPGVSPDGSAATVRFTVAPLAPTGAHVVRVVTPGGTSIATAVPANTFTVVNQIQSIFAPIESPQLGVVLQDPTPPPAATLNAFSVPVVVAVGPVVSSVSPAVGIIGQTATVTVGGSSLQGVTAIQFSPPDGLTVSAPAVSADGLTVTVNVSIASNAPQTIRSVRVKAGAADVAFANPVAAQFRVSAPPAVLQSVTPNFLQTGAPAVTLTIRGLNFQNASAVGVSPPNGISINNPPTVDASGTQITVAASAAANAATGPRAVTVTTPAGTSSDALTPQTTITITNAAGATITPVTSVALGVVLQDGTPPPPQVVGPVAAAALGVVLQDPNPPAAPPTFAESLQLGVAVGAVATGISVPPLSPNTSGTLTISGIALNDVTSVSIVPPDNIALGTLTIAPDGSQISVPITVQAGAAANLRGVRVSRGTTPVQFASPGTNTFRIGVGAPNLDSISPILASRGQTFTMIIRGQNFQGTTVITATPATGMFIDNAPTVNAAGTQIDVRIAIATGAPLEAKVIQVITASGASRSDAVPANTFTVQP
jgi:YD repeat-containing protein